MRSPKTTGFLALLALSLVAFFSAGCGSSESFAFTNSSPTRPDPSTTGDLQFRFTPAVAAQSAALLPEGAAQLYISLHTGTPPSEANLDSIVKVSIDELNEDGTYLLEGVDPMVNTVVILATTADELPLAAWQAGGIEVVLGETVLVDLGEVLDITYTVTPSPNPLRLIRGGKGEQLSLTLSFSNGTEFEVPGYDNSNVTFKLADEEVANVTATGLFSANEFNTGHNTTATVTYKLFGVEKSAPFAVEVYEFGVGSHLSGLSANSLASLGVGAYFTGPDGILKLLDEESEGLALSIQSPIDTRVTLDGRELVLGELEPSEGPIVIAVTYTDPVSGLTLTDTFTVGILTGGGGGGGASYFHWGVFPVDP